MDLNLIGNILLTGMELWTSEGKKSFVRKHRKILKRIKEAENSHGEKYTDSELALAKEELEIFYQAYLLEQNNQITLKNKKVKK